MDYEFDHAANGNIALTGELDLSKTREFTLGDGVRSNSNTVPLPICFNL